MRNTKATFRERAAAWFPVYRDYVSFTVGITGVVAQLVLWIFSGGKVLSPLFFGVCAFLVGQPDKLGIAVVKAVAVHFGLGSGRRNRQ